jgi:hypothetical protein
MVKTKVNGKEHLKRLQNLKPAKADAEWKLDCLVTLNLLRS